MNVTIFFDVLEERLKCLGSPEEATFPLQVIHFLRFLCGLMKSIFKNDDSKLESISQYDDVFVAQERTWDCGLACSKMVMNWKDPNGTLVNVNDVANRETPLWTIELFNLLQSSGVDVSMFTKCKGVNPAHMDFQWYANSIETDSRTTQDWFDLADRENWSVFEVRR